MGTRILELDTIQYPGSDSTPEIQVGSGTVTIQSGVNVDINGGTIDGTTIGAASAVAGSFSTVNASGTITGNVTGDVTGDIKSPNGTTVLNNGTGAGTDSTFTGTSTNADHVLVTDNESTSENNLITFVENAQTSTGKHGLEMDGNLTYNPGTGTVASTAFSGNGSALTALNATQITTGTIGSARVPTLNQNTTGSSGSCTGNAATVTNGVYTTGDQTIGGTKTFSSTITGAVSGNSGTVTNGVYTSGDQTIAGVKTFSSTVTGNVSGTATSLSNTATFAVSSSKWTSSVNISAPDFEATSDRKIKKNFKPVEDALGLIDKVKIHRYEYKENDLPGIGVIAQELQEIMPEAVSEGDTLTVRYNYLFSVLVQAVQELNEKVNGSSINS